MKVFKYIMAAGPFWAALLCAFSGYGYEYLPVYWIASFGAMIGAWGAASIIR